MLPKTMAAARLFGHGGPEMLRFDTDVPVPEPAAGEALIRVTAAGVNNTDINTRTGWYAREGEDPQAGGWTGQRLAFPRIQGADVCGEIVAVGAGVGPGRVGERVIVQACLTSRRQGDVTPWLGSERDGGFAQYVCAPAEDTHAVGGPLSDVELAAIPCAYGTAENLLSRAGVRPGETVLVTGASGNVGLAAVQLAKLRGARVAAIGAAAKFGALRGAGADVCIERGAALATSLGGLGVDAAIDLVGGPQWGELVEALRPGGRYAVAGAIAGPLVGLDLRLLYLKDLTFFGCTTQERADFVRLARLAQAGALRPAISRLYPLAEIGAAQEAFLEKRHFGKLVLIPPGAVPRVAFDARAVLGE